MAITVETYQEHEARLLKAKKPVVEPKVEQK